jgi:SAM-dependent methyltransferase
MYLYYPPKFYWLNEGCSGEVDWQTIIQRRSRQLVSKAAWLDKFPQGRLLDIGAQKGEFIWFMQERGWVVEGVELDNNVPNPKNMPIRYGNFLEMNFPEDSYDVITFWAVLEHVYYPMSFIERAAKLLKPGGRLIVLVTNLNSIQARLYRADDYPRHLTIFTEKSAKLMCKKNGLRVTHVSTNQQSIFGGSVNGGLLYLFKYLLGGKEYDAETLFKEWKQPEDKNLFWGKWKGSPSTWVRNVSRLDRCLSLPFDYMLDRFGFGFIMTFSAIKE